MQKKYIPNNAAKIQKKTYSKECCKSTKTQGVPAAAAPDTIFSRTIECLSRSPDPLFLLLLTTFTSDRNYKDLTFRPRSGYKKRIPTHTGPRLVLKLPGVLTLSPTFLDALASLDFTLVSK